MSGALAARSECVLAIPVSGCACYFARFGAEIRRCFWQTLFFGVFALFGAFEGLPGRSPGLLSEISGIDLISTGAGVVKLRARTKGRFFKKLLDFELASNNGNWQWAASVGCDAVPYFRIFNPVTQSEKFDPEGEFIRRYVPELKGCTGKTIHAPWLMNDTEQARAQVVIGRDYPAPVVDHAAARQVTLELYSRARSSAAKTPA